MSMGKPALDEHVADQAHDKQQEGRHRGEADDSPQHHFARPHRLGHYRVDRVVLDVGRKALRTEKQRQQQHQIARRGQHEIEIKPGGIDALAVEIPTGEQQQQDEHGKYDHHAAANRLLDRQPRQRPDAARRQANHVDHRVAQHFARHSRGRHGTVQDRRQQPTDDRCRHRYARHHGHPFQQGRGEPFEKRNEIFRVNNHKRRAGNE